MIKLRKRAKEFIKSLLGHEYLLRRHLSKELKNGEPEIHLLPLLGDARGEFLDVGANVGVYALYASQFFGKIIALEPHPEAAQMLKLGLRGNVEILQLAASDVDGKAALSIPYRDGHDVVTRSSLQLDANPEFRTREVEVDLKPVDSLHFERLCCIKIDVEGHELSVLNGARKTLEKFRPTVIIECEERHNVGAISAMAAFFDKLDYTGYFIHREALKPFSEFDIVTLQNRNNSKPIDGARSPDYVNNFIFEPKGNVNPKWKAYFA